MEDVEVGMRVHRGARNGDTITIDNPQGVPYRKIIVTLIVQNDNRYTYSGNRITYTLNLSTIDLILGTKKRIPFFGHWVLLTIPAGTSPYEKFDVTHEEYPSVTIKVKINATTPQVDEDTMESLKTLFAD